METVIATLVVFGIVVGAMSLGVAFSGRELKGSCGGQSDGSCVCSDADKRACAERKSGAA